MPPTVCANGCRAVYGAAQNPQFPLSPLLHYKPMGILLFLPSL